MAIPAIASAIEMALASAGITANTAALNFNNIENVDLDEWLNYLEGASGDGSAIELDQLPDGTKTGTWNVITKEEAKTALDKAIEEASQSLANQVNSNTLQPTGTQNKKYSIPVATEINTETNKITATAGKAYTQTGTVVSGLVKSQVSPAVIGAGVLGALGLNISNELYNSHPDFFKGSTIRETASEVYDSLLRKNLLTEADTMNMYTRFDPTRQEVTAYVDKDAFSLMALYGKISHAFDTVSRGYVPDSQRETAVNISPGTFPITFSSLPSARVLLHNSNYWSLGLVSGVSVVSSQDVVYSKSIVMRVSPSYGFISGFFVLYSDKPFTYNSYSTGLSYNIYNVNTYNSTSVTINNKQVHIAATYGKIINTSNISTAISSFSYQGENPFTQIYDFSTSSPAEQMLKNMGYYIVHKAKITEQPVEGITEQDGATLPSDETKEQMTDVPSTLQALMQQFVDLFDQALDLPYVHDGIQDHVTVIPITVPIVQDAITDLPITGTLQDLISVPFNAIGELANTITLVLEDVLDFILEIGVGVVPPPDEDDEGSANALYTIYNPTESQLNDFGAWLWSTDLIDVLKKLFSDPMDAIITLHRVFVTPPTGSTVPIKVGYLTSDASAKQVTAQYVTVDCGSVNVFEQFGNVFDYSPFTRISIYLPFIGFQELSVADVMRSTIHVVYHVDVITGTCLAEIKVNRDGGGGTIYQFSGLCSVEYPVSGSNFRGIVSAILSGGFAGAPLKSPMIALGVAGMQAHIDTEIRGTFSGNAGAMGGKKPYLIITRPQTAMADRFEHFTGYPANHYTTVGQCSGFIKCRECRVRGIAHATDEEKAMIESLLKTGVLVQ